MFGKRFWTMRRLVAVLAFGFLGLMLGSALPVSSQTRPNKPARPPIQELLTLIEAARQAGLTEDQIRQLTLIDEEGNSINAWDYLQGQLEAKRKQEAFELEQRTKVYLTVRDVFADLRKRESQDLDQLREQLPYLK
jgi:DNA segregation ATPase FtsK/SpoIIIE-like protein